MPTLKKNLNSVRKNLFRKVTQNIGKFRPERHKPQPVETIKYVLLIRPNHRLGNQILTTPIVQQISNTFPNATIDLFTGKVAPVIYANYPNIDRYIRIPRKPLKEFGAYLKAWMKLRSRPYDVVVNVDWGSASGRIATKFSRGKLKLYGERTAELVARYPDLEHFAKFAVYYFRDALTRIGYAGLDGPLPYMNIKLSPEELRHGKTVLEGIVRDPSKPTICLYTFATGSKCYSAQWWDAFYQQLEARYPEYNLFELLPVENVSQIDFRAPSLYSKDIREMAAVMANTTVYVGADCGVMHLASASGIPTLGFFAVTNPLLYAPYNPGSKALVTTNLDTEAILTELDQILKA